LTGEFALREHTADVAVEATGGSPGAVFAAVADGLAGGQCEGVPGTGGARFDVERDAEHLGGLLYDYLGRLIYERDVRGVLPVDNEVTVTLPGRHGGSDAAERAGGEANGTEGTLTGTRTRWLRRPAVCRSPTSRRAK
jgi:SHS2 domain-containing protein